MPSKSKAQQREKRYRDSHKTEWNARSVKWQKENKEKVKLIRDKWRSVHAGKVNAETARRHAAKLQATVGWADLSKIETFYEEARRLTECTGIEHEVDHIVPLRGKEVCGLHVETNLRVTTQVANARKNNKMEIN